MLRIYKAMAIAITTGIGASGAFAGDNQDGVIYFTGAIVEVGFRVQSAPPAAGAGLQARPSASGDQVVLDFRSTVVRAVSVDVLVEAYGTSSPRPLWMGDARSKADVLTKYGGFKINLLTADNGTLTLSRVPGAEPAPAVMMLSYQ